MNPSAPRHHFSGPLPQLNLSADKTPSHQPKTLSESNLRPPAMVEELIKGVRWDWLFDLSCNLSGKFGSLGMMCPGSPAQTKSAMLMSEEPSDVPAVAAAHAWVVALAQRAAMEIRQLALLEEPRIVLPSDMVEMNCVAFLAASGNPRGTGKRLTKALQQVGIAMTHDCERGATVPGAGVVQFIHGRPVQMVSPVVDKMAVPVAVCRIRLRGFEVPDALASLKVAMAAAASDNQSDDVLVMSCLWSVSE